MVVVAVAWRQIYAPTGRSTSCCGASGSTASRGLARRLHLRAAGGRPGRHVGETGLCIVLFLAGMAKIPRELYEAARLDGAGPVREFFAVTLPASAARSPWRSR